MPNIIAIYYSKKICRRYERRPGPPLFRRGGTPCLQLSILHSSTPHISSVTPLTNTPKTVSFKGMNSLTPSQENYGFCKRFDLVLCLFPRRLDLWKGLLLTRERRVIRLVVFPTAIHPLHPLTNHPKTVSFRYEK